MTSDGRLALSLSHLRLETNEAPPLPEMGAGAWLRITAADSGTGIPPDILDHIFDPFFTTKEPGNGTGLGLAQVHGIIQQHGGFISAESEAGRGTTFTIYLPLSEPAVHLGDASVPDMLAVRVLPEVTVLLVEDEERVRTVVKELLELLGYRVIAAPNGQSGLELFRKHAAEIAVVLCDIVMPVMGGVALYRALKAERQDVTMIFMSGYPLEDKGRALLAQGAVAWIQKPFAAEELSQKLKESAEGA